MEFMIRIIKQNFILFKYYYIFYFTFIFLINLICSTILFKIFKIRYIYLEQPIK
jgi:hypothetical protein